MSEVEKKVTEYVWKIDNFNLWDGEPITSYFFPVNPQKWYIKIEQINPKGVTCARISICTVFCLYETCSFSLAFLDLDGSPLILKEKKNVKIDSRLEDEPFIYRIALDKLLSYRRSEFPPNNTLTMKCVIYGDDVSSSDLMRTRLEFQQVIVNRRISVKRSQTESGATREPESKKPKLGTDEPESEKPKTGTDDPAGEEPKTSGNSISIPQALQNMYDEGFLSDCILRIGAREYPVHKAFLGSRSQVFKAMFTADMQEKDGKYVDIQDLDGDTLQGLLKYVYSDNIDGKMKWETAAKLYVAADKYALKPLMQRCSEILEAGLFSCNILRALKLADMHQDQKLKSAAIDFIFRQNPEIVAEKNWLEFEGKNEKLANEILRKLYLQNIYDKKACTCTKPDT